MGAVVGVDRPELAVLHHGFQNTSIEQLGLLNDALDHLLVGGLELGLDEADHGDIGLDLDVFAQVQAVRGGSKGFEANLSMLRRLDSRLIAANAIRVAQIDVQGSIDVSLEAPGHVVEAAVELDLAPAHLANARDDLNTLLNLIPGAVKLVGGGIARRRNGLVAEDKRVEGDDFAVGVEDVNGELSRDEARNGCDEGKSLFLAQHGAHLPSENSEGARVFDVKEGKKKKRGKGEEKKVRSDPSDVSPLDTEFELDNSDDNNWIQPRNQPEAPRSRNWRTLEWV